MTKKKDQDPGQVFGHLADVGRQAVADYLSQLGRKGGQAGTGRAKARSRAHYQETQEKARAARARNAEQLARFRPTAEEHRAADLAVGRPSWQCACAACTTVRAWEEKRARQAPAVAARMAKARAARKKKTKGKAR